MSNKFVLLLTATLWVSCTFSTAQTITLEPDEELRDVVEVYCGPEEQRFDTLRTFSINGKDVRVATTYVADQQNEDDLRCYIFRPIASKQYQQIFVDSQGVEGGVAELYTIFSANADQDRSQEIIALYRWYIHHYMTGGYIYEVRCYKNYDSASTRLIPLAQSPKFDCGFEGILDGKTRHAKYNTEAKIRRRLKQLGY